MTTHIFRISMIDDCEGTDCWRNIEIPGTYSLYSFAEAIVTAFDFNFDHAFGFSDDLTRNFYGSLERYELFADMEEADLYTEMNGEPKAKSVKKTKIGKVFAEPGQKMQFMFDYGDEWRFLVELTGFGERTKGKAYPLVLDMGGDCPEQYPDWDEEDDWEEEGDDDGGEHRH